MQFSRVRIAILSLVFLASHFSVNARAQSGNVYMVVGQGAVSVLKNDKFVNIFTNNIFKDYHVTLDLSNSKDYFLEHFFESNIVFTSLHANPGKLKIANGDIVTPDDLQEASKASKHQPKLVIIVGCETLGDTKGKLSFPNALGIDDNTSKRAYIGFRTFTDGYLDDRFFRFFLAFWMNPKPDGSYRTLDEARDDAGEQINHLLDLRRDANKTMVELNSPGYVGPMEPKVASWIRIVGDSNLKRSDLTE